MNSNNILNKNLLRYNSEKYSEILQSLISNGVLNAATKSQYIYCSEILEDRMKHLLAVYPKNTLHAVAIKSNSHPDVLQHIIELGHGLEAASIEEVELARSVGCPNEKLVFDSPVKTVQEIQKCNDEFPGMILNANCFEELDRLKGKNNLSVGIRINPLMELDNPGMYDVSSSNSKFGIPITDEDKIIEYAIAMDNCEGLHIHAGSEIGSQSQHIKAIVRIIEIAEKIRLRSKKLLFIDIGGGIPARMTLGKQEGLYSFFNELQELAPVISDYQIITEYGRFVQAHTAFTVSKVEYLLTHCNPNIALIHVGADLFPREIYSSHPPHHEIYVCNKNGELKSGIEYTYDIGGPLCFSGDFVKRSVNCPEIKEGDFIVIADTGANTLSMWSQHCSRNKVELYMYND